MTAHPPPWGPYERQQPPYPPVPQQASQRWLYGQHGQPHAAQPPMPYPMPSQQVTRERKRTSHGLHLFLTIITCGMWGLFVWLPLSLWHRFGPKRKTVTRWS